MSSAPSTTSYAYSSAFGSTSNPSSLGLNINGVNSSANTSQRSVSEQVSGGNARPSYKDLLDRPNSMVSAQRPVLPNWQLAGNTSVTTENADAARNEHQTDQQSNGEPL